MGFQGGHLGFQGALAPPGKVTLGSIKVSWSLNNNPVIFRDIIQGQRKIAGNPREVYRNLRGNTLVCNEVIWHFLGSQRNHLGVRGGDL